MSDITRVRELVKEYGAIRFGVTPDGRGWAVDVHRAPDGFFVCRFARAVRLRRDASDRSAVLNDLAAAWAAPKPKGGGIGALFTPQKGDLRAAVRNAVGVLRDLQSVLPSPRITEALDLLDKAI